MNKPIILAISGADPTGGAGIAADIEAMAALGCRCAPIISALTVQDTVRVHQVVPVPATMVIEQISAVLADMPVAAIKLGLLPDPELIARLGEHLGKCRSIPLVLDPVLRAGSGDPLVDEACSGLLVQHLIPLTTVATPNVAEARRLAPEAATLAACASSLLKNGCAAVLVKGADEPGPEVHNSLYRADQPPSHYAWPRLPGIYHGSGCTLASAIASYLARGTMLEAAVRDAQDYTWHALKAGTQDGHGQRHPDRCFAMPAGKT